MTAEKKQEKVFTHIGKGLNHLRSARSIEFAIEEEKIRAKRSGPFAELGSEERHDPLGAKLQRVIDLLEEIQ